MFPIEYVRQLEIPITTKAV